MYWFKLLVNAVCGHVYLWALFATVVDFSTVCAEESFRNFKVNKEYFRCKTGGCSNKIITVWSPYLLVVQYPSISIKAHFLGARGFSCAVAGFGKKAGLKSGKIWKSFFTLLRRLWHPPWAKEVTASDKASRHTREKTSGTQGNGGPPCEQSLMGRKVGPAWTRQIFEVAGAQTSELVNLVLSRQTGLFECKLLFIDKPMVITKPAVASTQLLGIF